MLLLPFDVAFVRGVAGLMWTASAFGDEHTGEKLDPEGHHDHNACGGGARISGYCRRMVCM